MDTNDSPGSLASSKKLQISDLVHIKYIILALNLITRTPILPGEKIGIPVYRYRDFGSDL